jgi:hypothetical protein
MQLAEEPAVTQPHCTRIPIGGTLLQVAKDSFESSVIGKKWGGDFLNVLE